jgi:hypothetical protein
MSRTEKKAAFILAAIAVSEGSWMYLNLAGRAMHFWRYAGFLSSAQVGPLGWFLAIFCAAFFTWRAARLPSVKANLISSLLA